MERKGEREEEASVCERNISWLPPACPTGVEPQDPGMFPDWESNLWPLALWDNAQPTEPCQPGLFSIS